MSTSAAASSSTAAAQSRQLSSSRLQGAFFPSTSTDSQTTSSGTSNLGEGVVRLFRENGAQGDIIQASTQIDGRMLAVLAVPPSMTPADFLTYIAPAEDGLAHVRLIRDASENRSIVLMKFRSRDDAEEFAQAYNGREFNSLEPETCHVVRISSVSIDHVDNATSGLFHTPVRGITDVYELPTCPVCLERMDSAVTGLVTVPCSHTFHCQCLSKWGDSRCPVCRYSQSLLSSHPRAANSSQTIPFSTSSPSSRSLSTCFTCESTTNLWICLICGNVGCGRYGRAHAHQHYTQTTHLYALELETQRVWDYAGDGYVHRLIQNRADGKLVELPSASAMTPSFAIEGTSNGGQERVGPSSADALAAEKVEAIGIEYSYLLTSQLDSQRAYYETQREELTKDLAAAQEQLVTLLSGQNELNPASEERAKRAEQRAQQSLSLARRLEKELREERAVSGGLMETIASLRVKSEEAEAEREKLKLEMNEVKDQLRDVMFFLEAKDKIEKAGGEDGPLGEAKGGSLAIVTTTPASPQGGGGTTKKKSKKKKPLSSSS